MGAWSVSNFGNDSALEWVEDFMDEPSMGIIKEVLQEAMDEKGHMEIDLASSVLAAAEVIAALKGKKSNDFPKELEKFLPMISLKNGIGLMALKAVNKAATNSELLELWEENEEPNPEWRLVIEGLLKRLA